MADNKKVWLIGKTDKGVLHYGMATGLGATVSDLPTVDVPQGSDAFDYTALEMYFFDGATWNK